MVPRLCSSSVFMCHSNLLSDIHHLFHFCAPCVFSSQPRVLPACALSMSVCLHVLPCMHLCICPLYLCLSISASFSACPPLCLSVCLCLPIVSLYLSHPPSLSSPGNKYGPPSPPYIP